MAEVGRRGPIGIDFLKGCAIFRNMGKICILLLCLASFPSAAGERWDAVWKSFEKINDVRPTRRFGVGQAMLDEYRAAHPNFNFQPDLKDLIEPQAKQIHRYFYDSYRIGDIRNAKVALAVFKLYAVLDKAQLEKVIVDAINEYYQFGEWTPKDLSWRKWPVFSAALGSPSIPRYLDVKEENTDAFLDILSKHAKKYQ